MNGTKALSRLKLLSIPATIVLLALMAFALPVNADEAGWLTKGRR